MTKIKILHKCSRYHQDPSRILEFANSVLSSRLGMKIVLDMGFVEYTVLGFFVEKNMYMSCNVRCLREYI